MLSVASFTPVSLYAGYGSTCCQSVCGQWQLYTRDVGSKHIVLLIYTPVNVCSVICHVNLGVHLLCNKYYLDLIFYT